MDKRAAIKERERLFAAEKQAKRDAKDQKVKQRACWWSFPWGHVWSRWEEDDKLPKKTCLSCGKEKVKYPHTGGDFY